MHRATLVKIMKALRGNGGILTRGGVYNDVLQRSVLSSKLNAILNHPWPKGLRHLAVEEKVRGPRQPLRRWVLTRVGREFLQRYEADESAMPVIPPYMQVPSAVTLSGKQFQEQRKRERIRKARWAEKCRWRGQYGRRGQGGQFIRSAVRSSKVYDEVLNVDPRSREFQKLTPLQKIQALRTRCGKNRGDEK